MTLTETPSATSDVEPSDAASAPVPEPSGLVGFIGTGDHKKIGKAFIFVALLHSLAGAALAAALAFERSATGTMDLLTESNWFQALTLSEFGMVFLVVLPLFVGLGLVVVPLQVGSQAVAFPRAAAGSFWGWLIGASLFVVSYGLNGGPGGGDPDFVDLWILALGLIVGSLLMASVCIATTVIALRPPGMYLERVPLFSWSMLVAAIVWLMSLGVLLAILALTYVDHRYGRVGPGGNVEMYRWIHWAVRAPQVFAFAIPVLGVAAEAVPIAVGARQRFRGVVMFFIGVYGVLSFGAWTADLWHTLVGEVQSGSPVISAYDDWLFVLLALSFGIPFVGIIGGWADTAIRGNRFTLNAPLAMSVVAVLLLGALGLGHAATTIDVLDLAQTSVPAGVASAVVVVALLGALAGLIHWSSKIVGSQIPAGLGFSLLLLLAGGAVLVAGGDTIAGLDNQPDLAIALSSPLNVPLDPAGLTFDSGSETGGLVATAGWAAVALGGVVALLGLAGGAFRSSDGTPDDPWDGHTLEWATSSPPVAHNFEAVALVTSGSPLLDEREAIARRDD